MVATRKMIAHSDQQQIPPLPLRLVSLAQGPVGMTTIDIRQLKGI